MQITKVCQPKFWAEQHSTAEEAALSDHWIQSSSSSEGLLTGQVGSTKAGCRQVGSEVSITLSWSFTPHSEDSSRTYANVIVLMLRGNAHTPSPGGS